MELVDLHCHALFGVDDGPADLAGARAILDGAYRGGTRHLCLTPHFNLPLFGDNRTQALTAFLPLAELAPERWPGLRLYLGNELRWHPSAPEWLRGGLCRTLNGTRFLLVDFPRTEAAGTISQALTTLLELGYRPVLAHAERYENLRWDLADLRNFRQQGVVIQVNAGSLLGGLRRAEAIVEAGLADLAASDSHNLTTRPPCLDEAYRRTARRWGPETARALFYIKPLELLDSSCTSAPKAL